MEDLDSNPTIPCEICGIPVPFDDYISHMEICQHRNSILNMLNPMLNTFLQNNPLDSIGSNIILSSNMRMVQLEDLVDTYEMNNIISELIGNVNHGVIDMNSAITNVGSNDVISTGNKSCSICLEQFENMSNCTISKTICDHYFCTPCIKKWLQQNRKCPLCCFDFNERENIQIDSNDLNDLTFLT